MKAGDYENTGIVNAADYVAYRDSIGGTIPANETVSPGVVDTADYDEWCAHFGTNYTFITTIIDNVRFANAGSGAGSAVPEPYERDLGCGCAHSSLVCLVARVSSKKL